MHSPKPVPAAAVTFPAARVLLPLLPRPRGCPGPVDLPAPWISRPRGNSPALPPAAACGPDMDASSRVPSISFPPTDSRGAAPAAPSAWHSLAPIFKVAWRLTPSVFAHMPFVKEP